MKETLYLKLYLSGTKIRINAFIRVGLCEGELLWGEAYTWSNTSVEEKVSLSAEWPIRGAKYGIHFWPN